ncbi:signal peptidase I [Candidatus Babeliales bacterium]|nr:signal peptidase I [Candidatus Babeliales bacterium]
MKELKNKFEKLNSRYSLKREHFKKIIEKWFDKGKQELHEIGFNLLQQADDCVKEIKEIFAKTEIEEKDKFILKEKLKLFKKSYKKLKEVTKPAWRQWIEAIVIAAVLVFVFRTYIFGLYHVPTGSAEFNILVGDRIWGNKMAYYFDKVKLGDFVIFDNPEFIYEKDNIIKYWWQKYIGFPVPILDFPVGPDNWVKRIIAVPGDVIEGKIENGKTVIYRNGEKLDEKDYVNSYPLIRLAKETGFIDLESIGPIGIPAFLRKIIKVVDYTYVPDKSFEEQPFYNMKKEEVIKGNDGKPILKWPYTPTYQFMGGNFEFVRSVDNFGPIRVPNGKYWVMGDSRKNSRDSRFWGFLDEDLIHGRASFVIYSVDSEESFWLFELLKHPIDFWSKSIRWNRFFKWLRNGK